MHLLAGEMQPAAPVRPPPPMGHDQTEALANARHDDIGRARRDPVENRATEVRTTKVFAGYESGEGVSERAVCRRAAREDGMIRKVAWVTNSGFTHIPDARVDYSP